MKKNISFYLLPFDSHNQLDDYTAAHIALLLGGGFLFF
jgi:hypothetical protein